MEQGEKKKKKSKWLIVFLLLAVILGISIIFWFRSQNYITSDNAQIDCNIVTIKTSVAGYVKEIKFNDNEYVKKGQVLVVLDTADLSLKYDEAVAALKIAEAKWASAKDKVSASLDNASAGDLTAQSYEQNVISSKANLEKVQIVYDRTSALFKIKAATQEQFETASSNLSIAQADYAKAMSVLKSYLSNSSGLKSLAKSEGSQVLLAEAQIEQCKSDLLLARHQLDYAIIKAPCDGIVSKRAVQEGQYISIGQNICAVVNNENFWVTANLKETQIQYMKVGQEVKIKVDAYPNLDLKGKIESFSGATGAKYSLLPPDNATGNFIKITQRIPVKISINELPTDKTHLLFPGMSVFVKIYID